MDVGAVTEGGLDAAIDGAEVIYSLGADEVDIAAGSPSSSIRAATATAVRIAPT